MRGATLGKHSVVRRKDRNNAKGGTHPTVNNKTRRVAPIKNMRVAEPSADLRPSSEIQIFESITTYVRVSIGHS